MTTELKAFAERIAAEHATAYLAEFGEPITPQSCGDWDAESLGVARTEAGGAGFWHELQDDAVYDQFRSVYFAALHGQPVS